jgi:transcription-repair coupling factor (superfamily II helicase)
MPETLANVGRVFWNLGDSFKVAMKDLDIRGAALLGSEAKRVYQ